MSVLKYPYVVRTENAMAKVINLKSKTGRDDLVPRREPYWHRVRKGLYLGYRKLVQGEGTWIARLQDDQGKKKYQALGTFILFSSVGPTRLSEDCDLMRVFG